MRLLQLDTSLNSTKKTQNNDQNWKAWAEQIN